MKLKELHALMQDMEPFDRDRLKVELEQYPTGPDIASRMLFTIESAYNDFEGKVVADLGCGTGMLAVGAALLGSAHVLAIDVDEDALDVALANRDQFEDALPVDFVRADVGDIAAAAAVADDDGGASSSGRNHSSSAWRRVCADTVVMNPPFGTRRKGADVTFLRAAAALVRARGGSVYSLHKSSTRAHLQKLALRELGCSEARVLAELRYDLPATYKFHRDRSRDIEVDLWRFVVPAGAAAAGDRRRGGSGGGSGKRAERGRQQDEEEEEEELEEGDESSSSGESG